MIQEGERGVPPHVIAQQGMKRRAASHSVFLNFSFFLNFFSKFPWPQKPVVRYLIDLRPWINLCYCITNSLEKESRIFTLLKSFIYYYSTGLLLALLKVCQGRSVHNDHYPSPTCPEEIHHTGDLWEPPNANIHANISNISLFSSIIACPDGSLPRVQWKHGFRDLIIQGPDAGSVI